MMKYNLYNCCLCRSSSARFKLCIQDNYQEFKYLPEFRTVFKEYNPYSYLRMCEDCLNLMKLRIFVKCDSIEFSQNSNQMQDSSQNIEVTNCQCESCRAKFGNLPLLAEVIEKIENKTSRLPYEQIPTKTENLQERIEEPINYSTKNKTKQEVRSEVQPSTSKPMTINRKIMKCEHCGKSFTHKGDMNKHLRKHTGEQPFSCPVCNRKFAHTSNLSRHLKVHSGDKPFHCERCNRSFSRKDKLVMHQKTKLCTNAAHSSNS